jgi:hypothetical protein
MKIAVVPPPVYRIRSLLRFARKTPKNRRLGDFLPCKLRKQPNNRGFFAASSAKNPQVQQAAREAGDPEHNPTHRKRKYKNLSRNIITEPVKYYRLKLFQNTN